ncbi:MAG TPA: hypothetical protein DHV62_02465 [Elusimicrobia bacterium]|jgi:hypothetical protein|nr:hypothetical protein [Elusimicrobiota bacterium]
MRYKFCGIFFFVSVLLTVKLSAADWPVSGNWPQELSSDFGPRMIKGKFDFHDGIDFPVLKGTKVFAARSGYVKEIGWQDTDEKIGLGYRIRIEDDIYGHLLPPSDTYPQLVEKGQWVEAGITPIGWSGATGNASEYNTDGTVKKEHSHLHFQVGPTGSATNPLKIFTYDSSIPQIKTVELYGDVVPVDKLRANGKIKIDAYIETITKDLDVIEFSLSPDRAGSGFPVKFDYHNWDSAHSTLERVKSYTDQVSPAEDHFFYEFDSGNLSSGDYTLTVKATDVQGNSTTKSISFTVDWTAKIKLEKAEASPEIFSPNSDGTKDKTEITYTLSEELAPVVEIYNEKGDLVREFSIRT